MLHPKIEIALDEIDAAVINGDTFHDADERAKLLGFVARWTRALAARVGTRTERPPLTDDHLTEKLCKMRRRYRG